MGAADMADVGGRQVFLAVKESPKAKDGKEA